MNHSAWPRLWRPAVAARAAAAHVRDTAGCKQELPRLLCAQTFIHREETLAQDVAAAPELHPESAVGGDKGLRGLIATKPTWEVEKNGDAAGAQQAGARCRQRKQCSKCGSRRSYVTPAGAAPPVARTGLAGGTETVPRPVCLLQT